MGDAPVVPLRRQQKFAATKSDLEHPARFEGEVFLEDFIIDDPFAYRESALAAFFDTAAGETGGSPFFAKGCLCDTTQNIN